MSKKLKSSLSVALVGAVLLLLQTAPASAQVLTEDIFTGSSIIDLTKKAPNVVYDETVTAPASCPCQVLATYFLPIQAGSSGGLIESEVVDEYSGKAFAQTEQQVPAGGNRGIQRADIDGTALQPGQSVEFQLLVEPNPGGMKVEPKSVLFAVSKEFAISFLASNGIINQ
jgi:hypothetical protein